MRGCLPYASEGYYNPRETLQFPAPHSSHFLVLPPDDSSFAASCGTRVVTRLYRSGVDSRRS